MTTQLLQDPAKMGMLEFEYPDWVLVLNDISSKLQRSCFMPGLLKNTDSVIELIRSALKNIHLYNEKPLFRVFVDGGLRFDLVEKIQRTQYHSSRGIHAWAQETLHADKYCLTLNGISRWSDELHFAIYESIVQPLVTCHGSPLGGVESYIFAGDYDFTPFGIHEDPDHSLIFHLGPGDKDLWVWPRQTYLELSSHSGRRYDFDSFCRTGTHYRLRSGDFVFIPKGDFHVFRNLGYSLFLGLILFPSTPSSIIKRSIEANSEDEETPQFFYNDCLETIARSISREGAGLLSLQPSRYDLTESILMSMCMLRSNHFDIHKPPLLRIHSQELIHGKLRLDQRSGLEYLVHGNEISVFCRGRLMRLLRASAIETFLAKLLSGESFTYVDARSCLGKELEEDAAEALIMTLYRLRAFEIPAVE